MVPPKPPGSSGPLTEKRDHYLRLMAMGMNNSEACRTVGVSRGTGIRWRFGRTVIGHDGSKRIYAPITPAIEISDRFLSEDERVTIADRRATGLGIRSIATELGRSPSTISREIRRNCDPQTGKYHPYRAQQRARERRARPALGKLATDHELREFVQHCLRSRWSPQQIACMLPELFPHRPSMRLCHETIYQALYSSDHLLTRVALKHTLRSGRLRRKRRRRGSQRATKFVQPGQSITDRPVEVNDRVVPGHWEGDLITGKNNKSAIGTLIERTTRFVVLLHLPDGHNAKQVRDALVTQFSALPNSVRRSLTWDQGGEMGRHQEFSTATGIPVYFCQPGKPWQRGSNENANGLLRQYFPKGTDLTVHTVEHLATVAAELNHRPRKGLGWTTPAQALARVTASGH
ncbi:IS30 family transposase [Saccharopolyspora endophytica]|uniref:IS30 family transposase n=2 Tax=Saccharopolyspora endophytica TaxID=543886 RepID=A0ABS5DH93_9PSEU|nr:IS30 family transposase [Saccharopolyspora endophytica]